MENLKIIPEFADFGYRASADGHIYNAKGRQLSEHQQRATGYVSTVIGCGGKIYCRGVSRMVAAAWLGEQSNDFKVRHLDGDPTNNSVENLIYEKRKKH